MRILLHLCFLIIVQCSQVIIVRPELKYFSGRCLVLEKYKIPWLEGAFVLLPKNIASIKETFPDICKDISLEDDLLCDTLRNHMLQLMFFSSIKPTPSQLNEITDNTNLLGTKVDMCDAKEPS